ncbi:MAG: hypothetical protein ACR2HG_06670 [Pyrinomonadaceae bacterium]
MRQFGTIYKFQFSNKNNFQSPDLRRREIYEFANSQTSISIRRREPSRLPQTEVFIVIFSSAIRSLKITKEMVERKGDALEAAFFIIEIIHRLIYTVSRFYRREIKQCNNF